MTAEFVVDATFVLSQREVVAAPGQVLEGVIAPHDVLYDSDGRAFEVIGIDFGDRLALVFAPEHAAHLAAGMHLTKPE